MPRGLCAAPARSQPRGASSSAEAADRRRARRRVGRRPVALLGLSLSLARALSLALALLLYRSLARALSAGMCVCFVRSTPHWMIRARETARLLCGQAPICACIEHGTIAMTRRRCDLSGKNGDCKSMLCAHREFLLRAQGETGYPSNVAGSARRTTFPE